MIAGIVVGAGIILAIVGFLVFAQDKGLKVNWWQWLLMAIGATVLLFGVGFLGTMLAEDTAAQGWVGLGIAVLINGIIGSVVWQTLRRA